MKTSASSALLLTLLVTLTSACTQRQLRLRQTFECADIGTTRNPEAECKDLVQTFSDFSVSHSRVWGKAMTPKFECQPCERNRLATCECLITAWRFREWMESPARYLWPNTTDWDITQPDILWESISKKTVDCD
ncbi:hypothetical protein J1614_005249 [Plenodomus biglobosus]|nr:hypothetical protein J1614_005249 [Plenodomus biglobosus]